MTAQKIMFTALSLALTLIMAFSNDGMAQSKVRYLDSQKVLDAYPDWLAIQEELNELKSTYEKEFSDMQREGQALAKEIESQSLLLSPEKKREKESQLQSLQLRLEKFYGDKFGPQGELYQKNLQMSQPVFDKINAVIKQISEQENYDMVLDAVSGGVLLFAKPEYDITQEVLDRLEKSK